MTANDSRKTLRRLADARRATLLPGAFNALSARLIEDLGFEAVYVTGAGVTNMSLGLPDQGFMGLAEIVEHTQRIRDAVQLPLVVDADTGFGNALNVYHAVRRLERAGADCIQLEDQASPKRCGHFEGKAVIETSEMVGKIRAAVDARADSGLLVLARTDAAAVHGVADALERAQRYAEAGADLLFVEALTEAADVRALPSRLASPLVMNLVLGGKTPVLAQAELAALGYGFVLYANAALQAALAGMTRALSQLRQHGELAEDPMLVAPFAERQRLVGKPAWDALEQRYAG
ncbi:MAG TPA: oxaloacetate decarboxylase [Ottowia sp.]|uniref:isocitrate lyase/PEP mutase family protein n=1 Tax=Ottowia sp. TaxID=1898956 RepID=UPI002B6DAEAA|nr:oxaloacetate decarboxylase [Ottowia sp.]HMN22589.1 oxaloacetate decarboxylase [Ottowia sp.]